MQCHRRCPFKFQCPWQIHNPSTRGSDILSAALSPLLVQRCAQCLCNIVPCSCATRPAVFKWCLRRLQTECQVFTEVVGLRASHCTPNSQNQISIMGLTGGFEGNCSSPNQEHDRSRSRRPLRYPHVTREGKRRRDTTLNRDIALWRTSPPIEPFIAAPLQRVLR